MITKRIKYEDYNKFSGESELSLEKTLELFDLMVWDNDAFLCFPINEINLFQIMFRRQKFLVEITNDSDHMIFHQKYASEEECKEIISQFFMDNRIDALHDYYKVQIDRETLDQVIKKQGINL